MKLFRVWVDTGLQGSARETEIEVEDDATADKIEAEAREAMFEMIEWGWAEVEQEESRK